MNLQVRFADLARVLLIHVAVTNPAPVTGQNEARCGIGAKQITRPDQTVVVQLGITDGG